MATQHSEAFVFFDATGDPAYKQVFLALRATTRRSHLDMPVIGVTERDWTSDRPRACARDSLEMHGGVDAVAFTKLSAAETTGANGGRDHGRSKKDQQSDLHFFPY
jgi:glucose-6-phosphate 1-dehydrogenase